MGNAEKRTEDFELAPLGNFDEEQRLTVRIIELIDGSAGYYRGGRDLDWEV